jgi:demethylmenaquinone methyltransferase/2-methoxy-6-polyprenyl-1,4-benzoquinol methylase
MSAACSPSMAALSPAAHVAVVREIFTTAHRRYDIANRLLSFRRDVGWREAATALMRFTDSGRLLDVATGTADLAIIAARRHHGITVTGMRNIPDKLKALREMCRVTVPGGRVMVLEMTYGAAWVHAGRVPGGV